MTEKALDAVLQVYDKVEYINVSRIKYVQHIIKVPSNKPTAEEMPLARKYNELHLRAYNRRKQKSTRHFKIMRFIISVLKYIIVKAFRLNNGTLFLCQILV